MVVYCSNHYPYYNRVLADETLKEFLWGKETCLILFSSWRKKKNLYEHLKKFFFFFLMNLILLNYLNILTLSIRRVNLFLFIYILFFWSDLSPPHTIIVHFLKHLCCNTWCQQRVKYKKEIFPVFHSWSEKRKEKKTISKIKMFFRVFLFLFFWNYFNDNKAILQNLSKQRLHISSEIW